MNSGYLAFCNDFIGIIRPVCFVNGCVLYVGWRVAGVMFVAGGSVVKYQCETSRLTEICMHDTTSTDGLSTMKLKIAVMNVRAITGI